jgi:hypothetical protein
VRPSIAFVEAGMRKKSGKTAYWTKLGLSFLHLDSSR